MSIYVSTCCMGDDEEHPAPLAYSASHILPKPGDDRDGSLDLGLIPAFITEDGWCLHGHDHRAAHLHDKGEPYECEPLDKLPAVWPYLRVSLSEVTEQPGETVVLDRAQVIALRNELTGWLARTLEGDPS